MTDRPVIEARSLSKSYGSERGGDGLDFSVMPGEVFGLLGEPSRQSR